MKESRDVANFSAFQYDDEQPNYWGGAPSPAALLAMPLLLFKLEMCP